MEVGAVDSDIDTRLHDYVALAEIELYVEVLTAVAYVEHRLSLDELDRVLGVCPAAEKPERHDDRIARIRWRHPRLASHHSHR